jgi:hypothetical protein
VDRGRAREKSLLIRERPWYGVYRASITYASDSLSTSLASCSERCKHTRIRCVLCILVRCMPLRMAVGVGAALCMPRSGVAVGVSPSVVLGWGRA